MPAQIQYARQKYGTPFREFTLIKTISDLGTIPQKFDFVTLIEVIEHLKPEEIRLLFKEIGRRLNTGGRLVFSTPNYASTWPVLEVLINYLSDISYEEQHLTKFTYFNLVSKLQRIYPEFETEFALELRTTTHFISPFLAPLISVEAARKLSRKIPHKNWKFPFGNLVFVVLRKT